MRKLRSGQEGLMLLEALIGLLIFSIGVLALVAMQSVSVSSVSNAKYRVEAAFYAEEIIHKIWLDSSATPSGSAPGAPVTSLSNVNNYRLPGGTNLQMFAWMAKIQSPDGLPGATTYPPTIAIVDLGGTPPTKQITVTVRWKAPDALVPSNHVSIGYVSDPY
jgi:type IV pilus assembly protein PilV